MNKKAEGLSVTVIVLLALGGVVLVIMLLVFIGVIKVGKGGIDAVNSCTGKSGECRSATDGCNSGETRSPMPFECKDNANAPICCIKNEALT